MFYVIRHNHCIHDNPHIIANINKTNLEAELAKPENYSDKNKFLQLEKDYNILQQKISAANSSYEQLFEKIMALES